MHYMFTEVKYVYIYVSFHTQTVLLSSKFSVQKLAVPTKYIPSKFYNSINYSYKKQIFLFRYGYFMKETKTFSD